MTPKKEIYLENVLKFILEDTDIDIVSDLIDLPFYYETVNINYLRYLSVPLFVTFKEYVTTNYSLNESETNIVYNLFRLKINDKITSYGYPKWD